jgi:hypothetical protein
VGCAVALQFKQDEQRQHRSRTPDRTFAKLVQKHTSAAEAGHERGRKGRRRPLRAARRRGRAAAPGASRRFIEEITEALAVAAETKDFRPPLQDVLQAWTVTVRLQQQPGYEAMIQWMRRRERGQPVDLDELRRPRG